MIRQGIGDAVGLVDSVVPGMICQGRNKAVAWLNVSRYSQVKRVAVFQWTLCCSRDDPLGEKGLGGSSRLRRGSVPCGFCVLRWSVVPSFPGMIRRGKSNSFGCGTEE